jgi:hypothetical protein
MKRLILPMLALSLALAPTTKANNTVQNITHVALDTVAKVTQVASVGSFLTALYAFVEADCNPNTGRQKAIKEMLLAGFGCLGLFGLLSAGKMLGKGYKSSNFSEIIKGTALGAVSLYGLYSVKLLNKNTVQYTNQ